MSENTTQPPSQAASKTGQPGQGLSITTDLVKQIADRVYAALQRDLMIERERSRRPLTWSRVRGGRS
jgi:hypothetical protein